MVVKFEIMEDLIKINVVLLGFLFVIKPAKNIKTCECQAGGEYSGNISMQCQCGVWFIPNEVHQYNLKRITKYFSRN